jgi:hypothetical protein
MENHGRASNTRETRDTFPKHSQTGKKRKLKRIFGNNMAKVA